jgi:type I restriction enzyme S subunit
MHVPEGFQQIPGLSVCPKEWKVVQANEICSKITKGTTPPKSDIVEDGNIPFLRVNNLTFEGSLNRTNELLFVSESAHRGFLARSIAYPNDILMNIVGPPLGKIVQLPDDFAEYNLNQAIIIYRLKSIKIDISYFLNYLKSNYAQYWLSSRSKKTSGQQNLTIELCKELPVPLPSYPEQQKIAQILCTWDKAIEKLEALIAAKQKRKKALMQQLLTGKKRFAGFEGEWKTYHLSEIFSERNESGFNDLTLLSITREKGVIPRDEVERKDTSNDDKSKYLRICPGDIGYNTMRMWQGVSALSDLEGIVSPAYTICVPKNNIDAKYASFLFKTPVVMNLFLRYSQGLTSDTWNLKFRHFSEIKITIPEKAEQQKIAFVLSAADIEIETHKKQLFVLKEQKKGLMQQILTGKLRVKIDVES